VALAVAVEEAPSRVVRQVGPAHRADHAAGVDRMPVLDHVTQHGGLRQNPADVLVPGDHPHPVATLSTGYAGHDSRDGAERRMWIDHQVAEAEPWSRQAAAAHPRTISPKWT
jgi:hypothetical protein